MSDWLDGRAHIGLATPVKYLASFVNGNSFKSDEWSETGTPIIRIENLNGSVKFNRFDGQVLERYVVRSGDLLFSWSGNRGTSFGPHMWEPKGAWYLNQHIFRVEERAVDRRWLYWSLKAATAYIEQQTNGMIGMVHVTKEELGQVRLPVPSAKQQRVIADYLDTETARIDAIITRKLRLIKLLEEQLWSRLVSDPRLDAPPASLRRMLSSVVDGPFGSSLTSAHYVEDPEVRVVRLGNIGFAQFLDHDRAYVAHTYGQTLLRHAVRPGNLLIAGLGDTRNHVGRAAVAPNLGDAIVKADCYCAEVDEARANAAFLAIVLSSPLGRDAVGSAGRGTTRSRINLDILGDVEIPLPTLEQQARLALDFARWRSTSESARAKLASQLELLSEHRQALITAAVTGELEIQGVTA